MSCVRSVSGELRRPGEVLLRGAGAMRRLGELLPPELVSASCGRALCDASDSSEALPTPFHIYILVYEI